MKAIKYIAIAMSLFGAVSARAVIIPAGGFGVNSNFIDNGIITTEYRADGTVWEWLDLTVTNGISFNSLVDDLNDDNTLNNSNTSTLNANAGALADVAALTAEQATGWNTVSATDIAAMFNSFFGTSLTVGQTLSAPTSPLDDSATVEIFIKLYGDTYHEGNLDEGRSELDANVNLENIGFTYGFSTTVGPLSQLLTPAVYDGQFDFAEIDALTDMIALDRESEEIYHRRAGTWLTREATAVSEPATALMFTVGLMGLFVRRRLS